MVKQFIDSILYELYQASWIGEQNCIGKIEIAEASPGVDKCQLYSSLVF